MYGLYVGRVYTFGTCRKGSLGHGDTRPQKIPKVVEALLVSLFVCLFVCLLDC